MFSHKGLGESYQSGSKQGIIPSHAARLGRLLDLVLTPPQSPQDMNLPGFDFHSLKGGRSKKWAVSVNGNWRIVFGFQGADAIDVDDSPTIIRTS